MIEPVKTPPIPAHQGLAEQTKRCAVYARVSVSDAHRGEMTSIEFQVEACLAYIASQRGLGWAAVEPAYKDEGVSGGTLQRPAVNAGQDPRLFAGEVSFLASVHVNCHRPSEADNRR